VALEVRAFLRFALQDVSFEVRRAKWWASTVWSAPGAPRSPKPCSACANADRGQHLSWKVRRSRFLAHRRHRLGISLVPENRKEQGLVLGMNCRDNMTLPQVE
jgi:ribose transport system ATP-binding protein